MELQEIIERLATIKKGHYVNVGYETIKVVKKLGITLKKTTHTTIRFVEYGHIKGVDVKHKPNPNEQWLPTGLIYNTNTQQYYLQMATIKNSHKKGITTYEMNGKVIDKETYNQYVKPSAKPIENIFRKNIKDIISLG